MSAQVETPQQQDATSLNDALAQHVEKMMGLKLTKLKKIAKAKGIPDGEIEVAAAGAEDEEDAKHILINLLLKAQCMKATAKDLTQQPEENLQSQMCMKCPGCIRPPKHEGTCMDGQCNDIMPVVIKEQPCLDVAAELVRHKVVKQEVLQKVEDKAQKEAAAEKEAQRTAAEKDAQRKAAEKEAQHKATVEKEVQRQVAAEAAAAAAKDAQRKIAEEHARKKAVEDEARQKGVEEQRQLQAAQEKAQAELRAAEEEVSRRLAEAEAQAARQNAADEEAAQKREEARAQRQAAEEAEMDTNCMETFLDTMKAGAWHEKIRTPIKGSILYTKHIRPNRPAGTSVDVKDSSFRCLGNFLNFLEVEGLLRLKPGLTDPVVTEICYGACRDYKYTDRSKPSAIKGASSDTAGYPVSGLGRSLLLGRSFQ